MSSVYLPDIDHVVRHVPYSKMFRDAEDNVLGCLWTAFELRSGEEFLSATWLEYFSGSRPDRIKQAVFATAAGRRLGKASAFAIGNVEKIKEVCKKRGARIRVINEADGNNPAHVAIRRWPSEDQELLEIIASEVWNEMVMTKDY